MLTDMNTAFWQSDIFVFFCLFFVVVVVVIVVVMVQ